MQSPLPIPKEKTKILSVERHRILHFEDDTLVHAGIREALAPYGMECVQAVSLAAGIQMSRTQAFDLIILDRGMPDGDGLDALRTLRDNGVATPTLILSAMGDVDNRILGLTSGADDYLSKPFAVLELVARVKNLVERNHPKMPGILKAGPIELHFESGKLHRAGRWAELLPREVKLLAYLIRNQNTPLTRAMLLRDVWHYSPSIETNVVDVHIGRLRKKIDFPDETPLILTVKNVGFMLRTLCE